MKTFHLPGFFRRDVPRKLVAIFFAVLIWLAVHNQTRDVVTFREVPVVLTFDADQVALERRMVTISVSLRGNGRVLENMKSTDIKVSAAVPVVREGVYHYDLPLSKDNVKAPHGTRVTAVDPTSVRLQLDRIVTRELPVRIRETGELAYGFQVVSRNVVPSKVEASGPSRIVNDVSDISSEPVVLDDTLEHSFEVSHLNLIAPPRIQLTPQTVHVTYEIARRSGQQTFMNLPIEVLGGVTRHLTLEDKLPSATVRIRGPKAALDTLQPHAVHPFIDISAVSNAGTYTFAVNVWINDDSGRLGLEYVHPDEVEVTLGTSGSTTPAQPPEAADNKPAE